MGGPQVEPLYTPPASCAVFPVPMPPPSLDPPFVSKPCSGAASAVSRLITPPFVVPPPSPVGPIFGSIVLPEPPILPPWYQLLTAPAGCSPLAGTSTDRRPPACSAPLISAPVVPLSGSSVFPSPSGVVPNPSVILLPQLPFSPPPCRATAHVADRVLPNSYQRWHARLGHLNISSIETLTKYEWATGVKLHPRDKTGLSLCEPCVFSKMHRRPVNRVGSQRPVLPLELVSLDTATVNIRGLGGAKHFTLAVCHSTKWCHVVILSRKSAAASGFRSFVTTCQNQFGYTVKTLRSDGEFESQEFADVCSEFGILHQTTCAHTPVQNSKVERLIRTIWSSALAMLLESGLPSFTWLHFVNLAVYLYNRTPHAALLGRTPYERWYGTLPDLSHLRRPGCVAYAFIPEHLRKKLDPRAQRLFLVGYSEHKLGYLLYNPDTKRCTWCRDVVFDEHNTFTTINPTDDSVIAPTLLDVDMESDSAVQLFPITPMSQGRGHILPITYPPSVELAPSVTLSPLATVPLSETGAAPTSLSPLTPPSTQVSLPSMLTPSVTPSVPVVALSPPRPWISPSLAVPPPLGSTLSSLDVPSAIGSNPSLSPLGRLTLSSLSSPPFDRQFLSPVPMTATPPTTVVTPSRGGTPEFSSYDFPLLDYRPNGELVFPGFESPRNSTVSPRSHDSTWVPSSSDTVATSSSEHTTTAGSSSSHLVVNPIMSTPLPVPPSPTGIVSTDNPFPAPTASSAQLLSSSSSPADDETIMADDASAPDTFVYTPGLAFSGLPLPANFLTMSLELFPDILAHAQLSVIVDGVPVVEPVRFSDIDDNPHAAEWRQAVAVELGNLERTGTWEVTTLPPGHKAIRSKWVFKVKSLSTGELDKFKCRLVGLGFMQVPGLQYNETFSPVAHWNSIRVLLALATHHNMGIDHCDVSCAFLQGHLDPATELYMQIPEGYAVPGASPATVLRLRRGLYGLKQASRQWNKEIDSTFRSFGFQPCFSDACVYFKKSPSGALVLVALFVDDMLICSSDDAYRAQLKIELGGVYEMTDLGAAEWFLNVRIKYDRAGGKLSIDQLPYILRLLDDYGMTDVRPVDTPALAKDHNLPNTGAHSLIDPCPGPYRELVGSLLYLALMTRPDILEATIALSSHCHDPRMRHWTAAKRVLRYLSAHKSYGITYTRDLSSPCVPSGYVDANYGCSALAQCVCDPDEVILPSVAHPHSTTKLATCKYRRSRTGYVIYLAGGPVAYRSSTQKTVTTSTSAAEYVAASHAAKEVLWLRSFLSELTLSPREPTVLLEDNKGTIKMTADPCHTGRTRHLNIAYHFVREHVRNGSVLFRYVPGMQNVADIFTKPLHSTLFSRFRSTLVTPIH